MARTLADLTLKLTRELSALEARCAKEVEQVERTRDGALAKIGSLEGALKRYDAGLAKAKQTQWKAVHKANESRDRATRAAEAARRPNMSKRERAYRKAKAWALRDRDIALRNAKAIRQTARRKTRGRPLSQHRAIRRAADRAFEQAVQKAREVYQTTLEDERFAYQLALEEILERERHTIEEATRKADRAIPNAAIAYERVLAREEAKLRRQTSKHGHARRIQEQYDRKLSQILKGCDRKKDALFRKFSQDRKKLKA